MSLDYGEVLLSGGAHGNATHWIRRTMHSRSSVRNVSALIRHIIETEIKLNLCRNPLCQKCQGSGYKGRVGAYELLLLDRKIQTGISQGLTDREIENLAVNENSMLTLSQYGVELVKDHLTTISEVIRVCKSD